MATEATLKDNSIMKSDGKKVDIGIYQPGDSMEAATGGLYFEAQPAYGVQPLTPISQPAYGIQYVGPEVQPAYGIQYIAQPAYGIQYVGPDIDISYEQIDENIATLESSIKTLKESWSNGTKKDIATLESSWAGKDCAEYTKKLSGMDKSVNNTISALELLLDTYKQAKALASENQAKVTDAIQNM